MIAPLAPHFGEECWELIGNEKSIFDEAVWFEPDEAALVVDTVKIAVQVNGKLRAAIEVPADSSEDDVKQSAYAEDKSSETHRRRNSRKRNLREKQSLRHSR
ncbi:MAG: class I tRNA ligase family protein [Melioribacteraceae bacterium]|nr:class I tRNA ligase family protein [Melioribacteraceae bacterium]